MVHERNVVPPARGVDLDRVRPGDSGSVDLELGALLFAALAGLSGLAYLVHLFVRAATSMP
jgi:hypothetical protein